MPDYRHIGNHATVTTVAGSDFDKEYAADPEWQLCPEPALEPTPAPAPAPTVPPVPPAGTIHVQEVPETSRRPRK